jgi:hypothetical protein
MPLSCVTGAWRYSGGFGAFFLRATFCSETRCDTLSTEVVLTTHNSILSNIVVHVGHANFATLGARGEVSFPSHRENLAHKPQNSFTNHVHRSITMNFEQKLSGFVRNGSARQAMLRKELGLDPYEATKLRVKEKLERDVEYRTSILKGLKTLQSLSSEEMRQACESMEEQVCGEGGLTVL